MMDDFKLIINKYPYAKATYREGSYYIQRDMGDFSESILLGMGDTPDEAWRDAVRKTGLTKDTVKTWKTNSDL